MATFVLENDIYRKCNVGHEKITCMFSGSSNLTLLLGFHLFPTIILYLHQVIQLFSVLFQRLWQGSKTYDMIW